jgi:serine/threonine protein phosphatase 1
MGDIHGAHKAMLQCFAGADFDYARDELFVLGDLCDGWPDVFEVFEELLQISHLTMILGNHDEWLLEFFRTGYQPYIWTIQGGAETAAAYSNGVPAAHLNLLEVAKLYAVEDNLLFVHGGIDPLKKIEEQQREVFLWDRELMKMAMVSGAKKFSKKLTSFDLAFLGHTPTIRFGSQIPVKAGGICMMDTGAGWPGGKLSIMDIDTGAFWQSDHVDLIYPEYKGR